ncbi:MAG: hypothetical protein ACMG6E_02175, partial [Candidatus Roizmanbacteria bacterium]
MDIRVLAQVYQKVTSNFYNGQEPQQLLDEISELKDFLRAEANMYQLIGTDNRIHSALAIEELDAFNFTTLV